MTNWIQLARVADVPPGTSAELIVADHVIALFNVAGTYYAIDGVCPHQGGPLGRGELTGCVVSCPWHGWQFDVTTGQYLTNPRIAQPCFPVCVEDEWILIDLEGNRCS